MVEGKGAERPREVPITGYLDRLSVRPGDTLVARVGVRDGGDYDARLVRVICADPNPAGPGLQFDDLSSVFSGRFPGRRQPIRLGSYARIEDPPGLPDGAPVTWTALVWPTLLRNEPQTVLSQVDDAGHGLNLSLDARGALFEVSAGNGGVFALRVTAPLKSRRWLRLWAVWQPDHGRVTLGLAPRPEPYESAATVTAVGEPDVPLPLPRTAPILIGALGGEPPSRHFNGRIEDPAILSAALTEEGLQALDLADPPDSLVAGWDFSRGIDSQSIDDVGPAGCHGLLVNLPTRGVRGARWSGREMCWRHAPRDYAAIHFHEDDLYDCGWQEDFRFEVPDDLPSGAYAFELDCGAARDWLPFYVLAPRGGPFSPVAVLASTLTHQAYANHARGNADEAYHRRVAEWGAYPWNPDQYPLYGGSTYNRHSDGSGICYSSRLRPVLTMRPGFLTFNDPRGSGLRHYPADSHLLAWMAAKGHAFDIVTDEDLDEEGLDLLRPYRAVLTGSHPEYHTARMLDSLQAYVAGGGRLAYLGGNGFYWRIARRSDLPGVLEVRRGEGGIRAWEAETGEYYHSLDGAYGGLWRRNGRPPQALVGVGFSGQGLFEGSYYRRLPASYDACFAWLFDGVEGETLGDFGFSGGGAAGFELDRADPALGTPEGAVILVRSEGHAAHFVPVPEELLSHVLTASGEAPEDLIRAEIVYFQSAGGGEVFSVGSISFCGALPVDGFDNPVSRLLDNLVRRFARDTS